MRPSLHTPYLGNLGTAYWVYGKACRRRAWMLFWKCSILPPRSPTRQAQSQDRPAWRPNRGKRTIAGSYNFSRVNAVSCCHLLSLADWFLRSNEIRVIYLRWPRQSPANPECGHRSTNKLSTRVRQLRATSSSPIQFWKQTSEWGFSGSAPLLRRTIEVLMPCLHWPVRCC